MPAQAALVYDLHTGLLVHVPILSLQRLNTLMEQHLDDRDKWTSRALSP